LVIERALARSRILRAAAVCRNDCARSALPENRNRVRNHHRSNARR
jgi:hypothetical protein